MAIKPGLLQAKVMHRRVQPKQNQFVYGLYYLLFPISQLAALKNPLLALDRFNLFGFYTKDHGSRDGAALEPWIRSLLLQERISVDGEILLLTLPRVVGYAFNPVSFWLCLDRDGHLCAVLAEVRNTFGEHHNYLVAHADGHPIAREDWLVTRKVFYVSPFMEVRGFYRFRFDYQGEKIGIWIDYATEEGDMLYTSLTGRIVPLTTSRLLRAFFAYPFITLKVILLIHYQAVKLLLKGIRPTHKPLPPKDELTR